MAMASMSLFIEGQSRSQSQPQTRPAVKHAFCMMMSRLKPPEHGRSKNVAQPEEWLKVSTQSWQSTGSRYLSTYIPNTNSQLLW